MNTITKLKLPAAAKSKTKKAKLISRFLVPKKEEYEFLKAEIDLLEQKK